MRHFANEEIAFDVPEDWTDASVPKFVFPEVGSDVSLSHIDGAKGMPLHVCAPVLLQMFRTAHPELTLVRERIEPGRWLDLVVEWTENDAPVRIVVRALIVDDAIWTLSARTPGDALDDTGPIIDRAMASFAPCA